MVDIVTPLGDKDSSVGHPKILNANRHLIITDEVAKDLGFPFTWSDLRVFMNHDHRVGWYLQQLIKLYAWKVIPDLSDPYLVLDADTRFLREIEMQQNGKLLFTEAGEWHEPYFEHMQRLHPSLVKVQRASGVAHHMPFSHKILSSLFDLVEEFHQEEFWVSFMRLLDPKHKEGSGASEYEIVFNYTQIAFPDMFELRRLEPKVDIVSNHWYNE